MAGTARYSVVAITLALALVVVELDALNIAQISDSLKGLALLDIVVADVELGQRPHILDGISDISWACM